MKKLTIQFTYIILFTLILSINFTGCTSLLITAMSLDPSSKQNSQRLTKRLTSSKHTLTVNVRGQVFNLRIDVIRSTGESTYCFVSSSKPYCTFELREGDYNVYLKIGDKIIKKTSVSLYSNKNIYLDH